MNGQTSFPVNLLRQHVFCPRIPFFHEIMGFQPEKPFWVSYGNAFHIKQKKLTAFRGMQRFSLTSGQKHFDCILAVPEICYHGIADLIIETENNVYPVDFKSEHRSMYKGQILQVMAYGVLAAAVFKKCFDKAFILSGKSGKTICYEYDSEWKENLARISAEVSNNLRTGIMPDSSASRKKCIQCEYLNFCNDRL
ncbi:MAG: hypothetical protein GQF41_1023 [Candidatus Rifleibacterium amylolyticum]|nr:MAG: hypothetical protein GQF41_1023 [Candidatus Rifleibacterium amylolyticum]NLF98242.1 CRISPR-associated protein Cas4 [Candidatus Riflebacteria bacterium]